MKRTLMLLMAASCVLQAARADSFILIRVSYKVILNPQDGTRPPGFNDFGLGQAIDEMNEMLRSYGRGYRLVQVDPSTDVGGDGQYARPSPSHYYNAHLNIDPELQFEMQADALANPALYAWNPNAINIYIGNGVGLGAGRGVQLILMGDMATSFGTWQLHEIGGYFDLCRTQGCTCECCDSGGSGECHTSPGSDGIPDTLPDLPCWNRDDLAQHNFGLNYVELSPGNQNAVDDVFLNVMAFHWYCGQGVQGQRMTEKQLDHWTDVASVTRTAVRDGISVFVQAGAVGSQNGRSTNPFDRVAEGPAAANGGGDTVLIRDGVYPENLAISAPVTLRAPRGHIARIGVGAPP